MHRILLLIVFTYGIPVYSQTMPVSIHSSVGDTIDRGEKIKYLLFENLPDDDYVFGLVYFSGVDSTIVHYTKNDTSRCRLNASQIAAVHYNIGRMNAFYAAASDTTIIDRSLARDPKADILKRGNYSFEKIEMSDREKKEAKAFTKENVTRTSPLYNLNQVQQQQRQLPAPTYSAPAFTPPSFPR